MIVGQDFDLWPHRLRQRPGALAYRLGLRNRSAHSRASPLSGQETISCSGRRYAGPDSGRTLCIGRSFQGGESLRVQVTGIEIF